MRKLYKMCLGLGISLMSLTTLSQDIHFSQFYNAPVVNSPSSTGMFDETFRFAANQRVQWRSISNNPYNTFALSAEMSEPLGYENLGAGITFMHDITGDSRFRTLSVNLNGAYWMPVSSDSIHSVSIGLQTGMTRKTIDYDALTFDSQYNGIMYDPTASTNENFARNAKSYFNLAIGGSYYYRETKRKWAEVNMALYNITRPKQSLFANDEIVRDRRYLSQFKISYPIANDWDIMPSFSFQFQGKYKELILGSRVKYILKDKKDEYRALYAGLFYRNADAGYLFLGMDYDTWHVGLSYDLNVSDLTPASNNRGGWEIALIYKLDYFKYTPKMHRQCPNYMK